MNNSYYSMANIELAHPGSALDCKEVLRKPFRPERPITLYRKLKRAVAEELGDSHFVLNVKYYPWYYEEDFPEQMEAIVQKDNPFAGWYKYSIEEKYEEYKLGG